MAVAQAPLWHQETLQTTTHPVINQPPHVFVYFFLAKNSSLFLTKKKNMARQRKGKRGWSPTVVFGLWLAAGVLFIIHYSCSGDEVEGSEWLGTRWIWKLKCKLDYCSNRFSALYEYKQEVIKCAPNVRHSNRCSFNGLRVQMWVVGQALHEYSQHSALFLAYSIITWLSQAWTERTVIHICCKSLYPLMRPHWPKVENVLFSFKSKKTATMIKSFQITGRCCMSGVYCLYLKLLTPLTGC